MSRWSNRDKVRFAVMLLALVFFAPLAWAGKPLGILGVIAVAVGVGQQLWRARSETV